MIIPMGHANETDNENIIVLIIRFVSSDNITRPFFSSNAIDYQ